MSILFIMVMFSYLKRVHFADDVGSNIEGAQAATAQGKSQLVKAAKTQRSNSSLVIHYSLVT